MQSHRRTDRHRDGERQREKYRQIEINRDTETDSVRETLSNLSHPLRFQLLFLQICPFYVTAIIKSRTNAELNGKTENAFLLFRFLE